MTDDRHAVALIALYLEGFEMKCQESIICG